MAIATVPGIRRAGGVRGRAVRRRVRPSSAASLAALVAAFALGGCSNPFSPGGTEPGVYKGASDPLFEQSGDERDAALRERFELIQNR